MHTQDQGIGLTDLPKAIVFHEVLGAGMAIAFWTVRMFPRYGLSPRTKEASG